MQVRFFSANNNVDAMFWTDQSILLIPEHFDSYAVGLRKS